jgi:23S rRNA (guanosine2251-2'-O)-methyltransferase
MAVWIYGFHPVREALRGDASSVARVLLARERDDARAHEITRLCERSGIPWERVEEAELSHRLGEAVQAAVHNGVAAQVTARVAGTGGSEPLLVLVEDVQDPRNLGALVRVCDAAGVDRLLVRDRGSAQLSPAAVKASAGAAEWLPVERVTNSANQIERLKRDGYWVYGAAAGGTAPWELDLTGKVLLCIGGEEKGLRQRTRTLCDALVGLPMAGRVESLNLATAAAAILFEMRRQRSAAAGR